MSGPCDAFNTAGILKAAAMKQVAPYEVDGKFYGETSLIDNPVDRANMNAGYERMNALPAESNEVLMNRYAAFAEDSEEALNKSFLQSVRDSKGQKYNLIGSAQQFFTGGFYKQIKELIDEFEEGIDFKEDNVRLEFDKQVRPEIQDYLDDLKDIWEGNNNGKTAQDRANIDEELKEFGLKHDEVYEAAQWLNYLRTGAPYEKKLGLPGEVAQKSAKLQAAYNVSWVIYNTADAPRLLAPFLARKRFDAIAAGLKEAADGFKRDLETRDPSYGGKLGNFRNEADAIFGESEKLPLLEPFTLTNRFLDRFTHEAANVAGMDVEKVMGDVNFVRHAIDATSIEYKSRFGPDGRPAALGLGRFMMAELYYTGKHYKNLGQVLAGKGDMVKLKEFAIHSAIKASLFGIGSLLPGPLFPLVKKVAEENGWKNLFDLGFVNVAGTGVLNLVDKEAKVSLTEAMAPAGLLFGGRMAKITRDLQSSIKFAADGIESGFEGKGVDLGVNAFMAVATASSVFPANYRYHLGPIRNLTDSEALKHVMPWAENEQLRRMVKALYEGWSHEMEMSGEYKRFGRDVAKALLGSRAVKEKD